VEVDRTDHPYVRRKTALGGDDRRNLRNSENLEADYKRRVRPQINWALAALENGAAINLLMKKESVRAWSEESPGRHQVVQRQVALQAERP
jgi:hypothetical protein